jgi:hypothetical protein
MERNSKKRKIHISDDINQNKSMEITFQFRELTIVRKRKLDIKFDELHINKYQKIYACALHDNDKNICGIYNCNGENNCNFTDNKLNYIN